MTMRLCQNVLPLRCGPMMNIGDFTIEFCSIITLRWSSSLSLIREPAGGIEHSICCSRSNYSNVKLRRQHLRSSLKLCAAPIDDGVIVWDLLRQILYRILAHESRVKSI